MKHRFRRVFAACALFALLLTACSETPQVAISEQGATQVVHVSAVGDILLTQALMADAAQTDGSYNFAPAFAAVATHLSTADLALGNLEGNFCGAPYGAENYHYPEALAGALAGCGLDVLQTANTCTVANGIGGVKSTIDAIQQAGLDAAGSYASGEDRAQRGVLIREVNGIRIAVLAFTKGVDNVRLPEGTDFCVNLLYRDYDSNYSDVDREGIAACVQQARDLEPDIIIAMVHWGSEYSREISETQEEIEDVLFYNGVDAIIGSHPHLAGRVQQKRITDLNDREKNVVTAYSLGDFFSDQTGASLILDMTFTKYTDGTAELSEVGYTPIYLADFGAEAANRFRVLHVENAIAQYQDRYYDRVSDELYKTLTEVPTDLKEYVEEPEEKED